MNINDILSLQRMSCNMKISVISTREKITGLANTYERGRSSIFITEGRPKFWLEVIGKMQLPTHPSSLTWILCVDQLRDPCWTRSPPTCIHWYPTHPSSSKSSIVDMNGTTLDLGKKVFFHFHFLEYKYKSFTKLWLWKDFTCRIVSYQGVHLETPSSPRMKFPSLHPSGWANGSREKFKFPDVRVAGNVKLGERSSSSFTPFLKF